jgi:hypothetical protein
LKAREIELEAKHERIQSLNKLHNGTPELNRSETPKHLAISI